MPLLSRIQSLLLFPRKDPEPVRENLLLAKTSIVEIYFLSRFSPCDERKGERAQL